MPITPPTLISYTEIPWTGNQINPRATAAVAWNSGDILVCLAATEGPGVTWNLPTATGLTFTLQKSNNAVGTCSSAVWTSAPGAGGSQAVQFNPTTSGQDWGGAVWVYRNSGGVGNSVEQHTATRTVGLTPTQADSSIVYATFDFNADTVQTITPSPTNTRQNTKDGTHYTLYVSDLHDQASTGSTSYGIGGANAGPFSLLAIEVKGLTSASSAYEDDSCPQFQPPPFEPQISVW